jgi:MFS family permease
VRIGSPVRQDEQVAKNDDDRPRKRFSKSGHTSHQPPVPPVPTSPTGPVYPPANYPPPSYGNPSYPPPAYQPPPPNYGPPPPPNYGNPNYGNPNYPPEPVPPVPSAGDGFAPPSYHQGAAAAPTERIPYPVEPRSTQPYPPIAEPGVAAAAGLGATAAAGPPAGAGRRIVAGSNHIARELTNRVIGASKANGADESGLTALIWNQVLSYGSDAMITVALAGTVFFGASTHAQKGNVLLYLLVTMAPFAVVAPVIGPALDRVQHGRRWAMAATGIGRAILAVIMAAHPTDLLVLYPCALGSLVLSKAYSVIRAAAAPRLTPPEMTLVEANSRISLFGLISALVGGGFVGVVIKVTGSYSVGLWVTAIAFGATAYFAFRLPKQVDAAPPAAKEARDPAARRATRPSVSLGTRLQLWAGRGFAPPVISSLQAESSLRFLSGFLTIFLAFYIESTAHGFSAALDLGMIGLGAGAGNVVGTAAGSRFKLTYPERVLMTGGAIASVACLLSALLFSITVAAFCVFISSVVNALGKVSLDAIIQRDVLESLRSSAFGRSETFLQLAWVVGAAIGVLLPSDDGSTGLWIGGGIMTAVTVFVILRYRAMKKSTAPAPRPVPPGSVVPPAPPPR